MTDEFKLLINAFVVISSQYVGYRALKAALDEHLKADDKKHAELDSRIETLDRAHGGLLR